MRTERFVIIALALGVLALALRPMQPSASASRDDESFRIAVCAIPSIINELMASPRFEEERQDLADKFEDQRSELQERLGDISGQARDMEQDDPALPALSEQFGDISRELNRLQTEFRQNSTRLQTRHFSECYDLARGSAVAIAENLGYDFVFASGSLDEELNKNDTQALLGQLSRRPVIKFPDRHDITDDVRDDLNL